MNLESRNKSCGILALPLARAFRLKVRHARLLNILLAIFATSVTSHAAPEDLGQVISRDNRTTLFARAVVKSGLDKTLRQVGPFIVFVPADQAMVNEGSAFLLNSVLLTESNSERLADLVRHHVALTNHSTADLPNDVELQTLANAPLEATRVGTGLVVAGYAVVTGRIVADNGIVYIVDRLLWPRDSALSPAAPASSNPSSRRRAR